MSSSRHRRLARRKRRIQYRLRERHWPAQEQPMLRASNIHYDVADRSRGLGVGGIGAIHRLARQTGLIEALDERLELLKVHLPYHESDHVLNVAYNVLCGGTCLEDLELLRNDEVYLDALGTPRIPDPTTAGDFCRRFTPSAVEVLMEAINEVRLRVWRQQDASFFAQATIDVDGTLAETTGECKEGMDISYKGQWGYHPLLVSLANTQEPLYLVNRSGNRRSNDGAAARIDQARELCRRAGFAAMRLRGDTDFMQSTELDRWDEAGDVTFLFGVPAMSNLIQTAESLPQSRWKRLRRPAKYEIQTAPRWRPANVKAEVIKQRKFENLRLNVEHVATFEYSPTFCRKTYRMVVLRKNISREKGERVLFDEIRYLFYITNDWDTPPDELVFEANGRCHQENLIEQLKNEVRALRMPVDNLVSNWAYMVMASLAWTLKAWFGLLLPATGRWKERYRQQKQQVQRMEFKRFVNGFIRLPCQIVRTGRRIVYRLLSWNPWVEVLLRGVDGLQTPLRC